MPAIRCTDYYACSVAAALDAVDLRNVAAAAGTATWSNSLATELMRRQQPAGSWINSQVDVREDDPLIASAFAIRSDDLPGVAGPSQTLSLNRLLRFMRLLIGKPRLNRRTGTAHGLVIYVGSQSCAVISSLIEAGASSTARAWFTTALSKLPCSAYAAQGRDIRALLPIGELATLQGACHRRVPVTDACNRTCRANQCNAVMRDRIIRLTIDDQAVILQRLFRFHQSAQNMCACHKGVRVVFRKFNGLR